MISLKTGDNLYDIFTIKYSEHEYFKIGLYVIS